MTEKPLRADARRNRERIVETARAVLLERDAQLSLEAVAKRAGVGVGTVYRHFDSREALVLAVYDEELDEVCAMAAALLEQQPPERALRAWFERYADFVHAKRGMGEALAALIGSGAVTAGRTRGRLADAVTPVLRAGATAGTLRDDVAPDDVVAGMAGALMAATGEDPRGQAGRLLDLLLAGLRT